MMYQRTQSLRLKGNSIIGGSAVSMMLQLTLSFCCQSACSVNFSPLPLLPLYFRAVVRSSIRTIAQKASTYAGSAAQHLPTVLERPLDFRGRAANSFPTARPLLLVKVICNLGSQLTGTMDRSNGLDMQFQQQRRA